MNIVLSVIASVALFGLVACQSTTGKTAGQTVNDAGITASIQAKLTSDKMANFPRIDVDTERGVVTLSGIVKTEQDRDRVVRMVREVEGVRRVNNHLQIQTDTPTSSAN